VLQDPFNALSTAAAARKIPPLKEAPPAKVMSCALVALTYLEKDLDAAKEVTGGAGTPLVKMAGRPWFVAIQLPMMRAGHHQRAKVPLVPEALEHASLVLFPLVQRLGRSTDRSHLHVPQWGSSLRGR
jgi:hypothetical protein